MSPIPLPIVILAAGSSSRMRGQDKLMRQIAGQPLIARVAARAIATGAPVYLCLPAGDQDRHRATHGLNLTIVEVDEPHRGMSVSLAAGLAAIGATAPGVLLLLADMPDVTTDDISLFINLFQDNPELIYRAANAAGQMGHPVVIPGDLLAAMAGLSGDAGARPVLGAHSDRLKTVELDSDRALVDLDTPEEWEAWEKAHPPR